MTPAVAGDAGLAQPWRMPRRAARTLKGVAGIVLMLVAWQVSVPIIGMSSYFYPTPLDVWAAFIDLVHKGVLPVYIADSLVRYGAGVGIGAALGIVFGIAIGLSRRTSLAFSPLFKFLFALVEVAWIPIFVVWFGYGVKTIVLALIYVVFFPVMYNTLLSVRTAPAVLVNAVRSLGGGRVAVMRYVILPSALPGMITGLRLAAGFAFRGLVFGEFIAAKTGVGYLIFEGAQSQQTSRSIVGMIIMGLMWLAIDQFYLRPFERATVQRWGLIVDAADRR